MKVWCARRNICWLLVLLVSGCSGSQKTSDKVVRPQEKLTAIINEFMIEQNADVYRLPYPVDAQGKNLFSGTLRRLEDWSNLYPNQAQDIVQFTRGRCYEKLGDLQGAIDAYKRVDTTDPELKEHTRERLAVMQDLQRYFPSNSLSSTPEAARSRSEEAIEKYKKTPYESLVMLLAENQAVEETTYLQQRQESLGVSTYREALEDLINRFPESKRKYEHRLRLGIHYEDLAREWITRGDTGKDPEAWKMAQQALDKANQIYIQISQADGYREKKEAESRLGTLDTLAERIRRGRSE